MNGNNLAAKVFLAGAVAVLVSPSAAALPVPRGCRRLSVVHSGNIDAVYEDAAPPQEAP